MTGHVDLNAEQERLLAAVAVLRTWLERLGHGRNASNDLVLLSIVLEKTEEQASAGVVNEEIQFPASELNEELVKATNKRSQTPTGRRIRDLWKRAENRISEDSELLADIARELSLDTVPVLPKSQSSGGPGLESHYYLEAEPALFTSLPEYAPTTTPTEGVHYEIHSLSAPPAWLHWLDGLNPQRGMGHLLTGVLFLGIVWLVLIGVGTLWLLPHAAGYRMELLTVAIVLVAIPWVLLGPFYRVLHYRIICIPAWWFGLRVDEGQLQYTHSNQSASEIKRKRRLHIVDYVATCPRCGGRIEVVSGAPHWWGRLVGRCLEAPREHIYSFDHLTRVGGRLR